MPKKWGEEMANLSPGHYTFKAAALPPFAKKLLM